MYAVNILEEVNRNSVGQVTCMMCKLLRWFTCIRYIFHLSNS